MPAPEDRSAEIPIPLPPPRRTHPSVPDLADHEGEIPIPPPPPRSSARLLAAAQAPATPSPHTQPLPGAPPVPPDPSSTAPSLRKQAAKAPSERAIPIDPAVKAKADQAREERAQARAKRAAKKKTSFVLYLVGSLVAGAVVAGAALELTAKTAPGPSANPAAPDAAPVVAADAALATIATSPQAVTDAAAPPSGRGRTITAIGISASKGYQDKKAVAAAFNSRIADVQACVREGDLPANGTMSIGYDVDPLGGSLLTHTDIVPDSFRGTPTAQCIDQRLKSGVSLGPADANFFQMHAAITITLEAR